MIERDIAVHRSRIGVTTVQSESGSVSEAVGGTNLAGVNVEMKKTRKKNHFIDTVNWNG